MLSLKMIHKLFQWSIVPLGGALISIATTQPASYAQPPTGDNNNAGVSATEQPPGTTVLTRGPIHEAFGQPTIFNPKPGLQIPKKPPAPVEELPPDEKPEGDNVSWIGGYWSWDEEKSDFMWISGFWRVLPPNRQWMPGYWNESGGQFQWVSGYWASAQQQQQEFIQQAPQDSLEQGAPPTAPSQDHIWAPGTWVYRDSRYLWRPGYWVVNQPGWAWVPATYIWTPSGYIFVDGYWDWSIRRRGVIFAPCYFDYAVCYRPGFVYRPAVCLDVELITPHFFCRPAYSHYYFGDYYASSYLSIGITPWFNFTYARGSRFYSCDFAYYECHYRRTNPNWSVEIRLGYDRCRDNVAFRPPRTFVAQQTIINNTTIINNKTVINNNNTTINKNTVAMAKPMKTYTATMAKSADAPMKFEKINETKARDFGKTATEIRKVGVERVALEKPVQGTPGKTGSTTGTNTTIRTVNMPKSPIVSKATTTTTDAGNGKNPNVGSISGGISKTPPPIPGGSGTKTLSGTTGTGTSGGIVGTTGNSKTIGGTTGTGNTGSSKTGTMGSSGSTGTGSQTGTTGGTVGTTGNSKTLGGTTGTGSTAGTGSTGSSKTGTIGNSSSTGSNRIPPIKGDSPTKGSGSSSGTGSKSSSSGSGTGSKSSGSSSGNSKSGSSTSGNGKDKP